MEKPQLINFIAKVMEDSGFKVYKEFKTSQFIIDIYAVLPTTFGDFGVVVECNNYDKDFPVSIEPLKHMEKVSSSIRASKIVIVSSSYFTEQATNYALKKNIKLVDRADLLALAKRFQDEEDEIEEEYDDYDYDYDYDYDDDYDYDYDDYVVTQRESNPVIYQNSLYRREYNDESTGVLSFLKSSNVQSKIPSLSKTSFNPNKDMLSNITPHLGNPIALIILVVLITYILSYIGGAILKLDHVIISGIQIFFSLVLSYGFTFLFADRSRNFIIRGTVVFFISLIILIIFILI